MTRAARVRGRVLDWKFLAALAFLLMVAYLVIGGYTEQVAKGRRIDSLIAQGQEKDRKAEVARLQASQERDRLRHNQERLLRLLRLQIRRQEALGRYLLRQGVTLNIPDRLLTSPPANKEPSSRTTPASPKTVPNAQHHTPKPPPPGGPSPPPGGGAPPPPAQPNPVQDLLDTVKGLIP